MRALLRGSKCGKPLNVTRTTHAFQDAARSCCYFEADFTGTTVRSRKDGSQDMAWTDLAVRAEGEAKTKNESFVLK
jgi:hypothetical protein